jgi:hypothetical protein
MGGVVEVEDSGILDGEQRMPLGEETSRGPDDKLDNSIFAMRSWSEDEVRAVCDAMQTQGDWRYVRPGVGCDVASGARRSSEEGC